MSVESRKVQKVGTSTLSVSLPKEWAERQHVEKGDVLLFEDLRDGSLRITPSALGTSRLKEATYVINADMAVDKGMLGRIVVGNYVIGHNHLLIKSKTRIKSEHIREVREAAGKLTGMGIMLETPETIELQCSIDAARFPMETVIKRLYTIGATMQKEALEALVQKEPRLAEDARGREDEADKVYWLALRLLLTAQVDGQVAEQIGIHDQLPIVGNRLICKNLEHVADYADNIAKSVLDILERGVEVEAPLVKKLQRANETAARIVADGLACIFTHDLRLANKAIEAKSEVERIEEDILTDILKKHEDPALVASLRAVAWSVRRIAEYGSEIAVIGINRYLERESQICKRLDEGAPFGLKRA
ncbi:MAG TPA: PhoU domain-containing protein [Candidatus Thermoplasmatota archaeon]|nr:PhoU domain-containing protein [Candidatus Thermoplasmatota archaeon]